MHQMLEIEVFKSVSRELLQFLVNFVVAESIFVSWCWVRWVSGSTLRGEAIELVAICALLDLPLAFIIIYPPIRFLAFLSKWWSSASSYTYGSWCFGLVLGLGLGIAATQTRLFWLLIPLQKLLGFG